MQFHNKNQIAYFCALTLLFSYIEMILPRFIPFFRLGFSNVVILLAFELPLKSFLLLSVIKALAASLTGGTLFTPFFLISLLQSFLSAAFMYLLFLLNKKTKAKLFSVYGISVLGSAVSAFVQIYAASVYLGEGTFFLLGPMLIFNTVSGIVTAFFSTKIFIKKEFNPQIDNFIFEAEETANKMHLFFAFVILFFSILIFFIERIYFLTVIFIFALIAQKLCKRKIYILPYISLWIFIFVTSLFLPEGKVIFKIWDFSFTQDSLITALQKALRLSAVSALSQIAVCLKLPQGNLISQSVNCYKKLSDTFRNTKGNLFTKIKVTLG